MIHGSQSQESTSARGQDRRSSRAGVELPHLAPGQSSHSCRRGAVEGACRTIEHPFSAAELGSQLGARSGVPHYSSDDAEEVSQHHISTPVSTRSVTFEGSRLARNVSSSADTVIIQHPQPGGLSHVESVQGNNMSTARTRLASDQSDSPLNRPTLAFPSFSPVFATRDIEYLPKKCKYSAVPQESSPSAVVTPSKRRHSAAESVTPSSSRRKACSQCRDRKLKCDLDHPCSNCTKKRRGKASQVFTCEYV
ncbi:BQ5605_C020g09084 [Microbotryum silenes-dioicae]|uniref:BQ5605_C020g09084 protein n=1 Tax=Microbotryum silenes-dioicae TaxID=796604 RepID=A0A2X0PKC0_9BASI|nr:BQ5605_C020g09084 [Microbotryum silenes-dioicae]